MQTKRHSIIESISNVVIGYCTALITQIIIFPIFNIHTSQSENMKIALIFTIISLIRNYFVRRWFTRKTESYGK